MDWIESLVLGVVQGLTEFLPISSDGHLTITQLGFEELTGRYSSPADKIFFDVMLHVGTLLAILLSYRNQIIAGAKGLLNTEEVAEDFRRPALFRMGILAVVATLPLIPDKLLFIKYIEEAFQSLTATGVGFLITAAILLITMRLKGGEKGPSSTTWLDAMLVGIAQMFAPLPGVSRSGLTISAALALGFSRTWAVNFSLMMAVPAIIGAMVFELRKLDPSTLTADRIAQIVVAAALAGVIGYLAIVWLVRLVRSGRLWYFSVYLVLLGTTLIVLDSTRGKRPDVRPSTALEGPIRSGTPRSGDRMVDDRGARSLAGPYVDGPGSGDPQTRPTVRQRQTPSGLVLGRRLEGGSVEPR
ncbi:undecaprenyl-diphosphate phosphatase [Tundrisphaera lichenicola]|uniref:undecaprenyl-diphosphate phosphatase n=1 Tax=Tundrisphaera lichenicola TaxID=2029860 RepID=UPI003EBE2609